MTIYFTHINRLSDNIIFSSTLETNSNNEYFIKEASKYYSKLQTSTSPRLSYPCQHGVIHFVIRSPIYAVCATDSQFEPPFAYEYLEECCQAFLREYSDSLMAITGNYACMDLHSTLDLIRQRYINQLKSQSLSILNGQLVSVRQSMAQNVSDALDRGVKINEVSDLAQDINHHSASFKHQSTELNRLHIWRTYGRPSVIVGIVVIVYLLVSLII